MKTKAKTSLERGGELMSTPFNRLPLYAFCLMKQMCKDMGGCGEVMLTAYCIYAEVIEGYPAKDREYSAAVLPKYAECLGKKLKATVEFV